MPTPWRAKTNGPGAHAKEVGLEKAMKKREHLEPETTLCWTSRCATAISRLTLKSFPATPPPQNRTPLKPLHQPKFSSFARTLFAASAEEVARKILGHWLLAGIDGRLSGGRIVEVEAYHEADPASHSHPGPTARNQAMFGPPGHAYVYLSYGVHHCVNIVCRAHGVGEAVLIRALAPEFGLEAMTERRGTDAPQHLLSGPGKICQALGIDRRYDHVDLCNVRSPVFLACAPDAASYVAGCGSIAASPRIGITKAAAAPLRFFLKDSPLVSRPPKGPRKQSR
jgi:DNA-3-methyladenine glycosylase